MRRIAATLFAAGLIIGGATPALADPHPSQGANSEVRNLQGFGGNPAFPHCHVLITNRTPFDSTPAFPSHLGHAASGVEHIFAADFDCDGVAG